MGNDQLLMKSLGTFDIYPKGYFSNIAYCKLLPHAISHPARLIFGRPSIPLEYYMAYQNSYIFIPLDQGLSKQKKWTLLFLRNWHTLVLFLRGEVSKTQCVL